MSTVEPWQFMGMATYGNGTVLVTVGIDLIGPLPDAPIGEQVHNNGVMLLFQMA